MSDQRAADTTMTQRAAASRPAGLDAGTTRLLERVRPWALRQAERSYGHLPESDRADAVDAALAQLSARGAVPDTRSARVRLAADLTAQLRHAHVAWCLEQSSGGSPPASVPGGAATVTDVVERGLKGLERAVMQLELGAGRETSTARAALRLGPHAYAQHRSEGLTKLRAAISGQVEGRVCHAHTAEVVLAATGDDAAVESLRNGPDRCRSCSREAQSLRRILHQRLGVAPWPLTIKPMGVIAAKLAGLGAVVGGGGAAGGSFGLASGALSGLAATIAGVAAIGTATGPAPGEGPSERAERSRASAPRVQTVTVSHPVPQLTARPQQARTAAATRERKRPRLRAEPAADGSRPRTERPLPARAPSSPAAAAPAPTPAPPAVAAPQPPSPPAARTSSTLGNTARGAGEAVAATVRPVAATLPEPVRRPVQDTITGVEGTLDGVASTVEQVGAVVDGVGGAVSSLASARPQRRSLELAPPPTG